MENLSAEEPDALMRARPYVRNYRIRLLPRVMAETGPSQPRARGRGDIASVRLCVRNAALIIVLPLADRLPSTTSAGAAAAPLFGGFPGTTRSSDFPGAYMPEVRSWTLSGRPAALSAGTPGISPSPVRRVSTRAQVLRLRGVRGRLAYDVALDVAFRFG
jgi:hypothetical protein